MGTIKKITAVKRRALCPKCFSIIEWDNAEVERQRSDGSRFILCTCKIPKLDGSQEICNQEITINKINPDDYLDNSIVFEPVEDGEIVSIDSEQVNFNNIDSNLDARDVNAAIVELENNINILKNGDNIKYSNVQSELKATNIQNAIDELNNNIKTINKKEIQAESIIYDNTNSDLESTNIQNIINELDEKINNINSNNNNNNNITTILLSEIKNTNDGIFFIFYNLNSLVNILNNISETNVNLGNYIISLDIIHPTFVIKYICSATYQNNSNEKVLHIFTPNNTEIITVTTSTITWKTSDSRTVNIPISAIDADGKYIYYVS